MSVELFARFTKAVEDPCELISITVGDEFPGNVPDTFASSGLTPLIVRTPVAPSLRRNPSARAGASLAPIVFEPCRRKVTPSLVVKPAEDLCRADMKIIAGIRINAPRVATARMIDLGFIPVRAATLSNERGNLPGRAMCRGANGA